MFDPFQEALIAFLKEIVKTFRVEPTRFVIEIREDAEHPLSFPLVGIMRMLFHQQFEQQPAQQPPAQEPAPQEEAFPQCGADILDVLGKAGFPLTTTRIEVELSRAGKKWKRGKVFASLRAMTLDGTLLFPADATPKGYRLPEWESTINPEPKKQEPPGGPAAK